MALQNGNAQKLSDMKEEEEEMNGQDAGGNKPNTTYIRPSLLHPAIPEAKVSEYLVGIQLDEAIAAGDNLEIYWPLDEGNDIRSWSQVEALW